MMIVGANSSHAPQETSDFLGKLLTCIMYHEFDKAVAMIMKLDRNQRMDLDQAASNLSLLCSLDY